MINIIRKYRFFIALIGIILVGLLYINGFSGMYALFVSFPLAILLSLSKQ